MNPKLLVIFCAVGLLAAGLALQARPPKAEMVSYKSGSDTVSGYLVLPEGAGKHSAIILIHEWWGLNDWAKEAAGKFADQGYVVLAVDLYRGKVATDPETAHELMRGLPSDRGMRDLEAAFAYLASRPDVNADKIASVGWCMGGGWSIQFAVDQPRLAACIVNYGPLPTEPANLKKIKAPVQGNFGAKDQGITVESVRAFESAMKNQGNTVDIKIYADAGHAFQNPNNKDGYRPEDSADAWKRMTAFFKQYLQ